MTTEYRPGVCNIGQAEQRLRYGFSVLSFLVAAAFIAAVVLYSLPQWTLFLVAAPLLGGFVGYYQGREAFCVGYAVAGLYNVGDEVNNQAEVSDEEAARRDRRHALKLMGRAALAAVAVTILLYLVVPA